MYTTLSFHPVYHHRTVIPSVYCIKCGQQDQSGLFASIEREKALSAAKSSGYGKELKDIQIYLRQAEERSRRLFLELDTAKKELESDRTEIAQMTSLNENLVALKRSAEDEATKLHHEFGELKSRYAATRTSQEAAWSIVNQLVELMTNTGDRGESPTNQVVEIRERLAKAIVGNQTKKAEIECLRKKVNCFEIQRQHRQDEEDESD